ncbi:MAG: HAD family hydrolase, partial [Gaiellales bacterium]
WFVRAIQSHGNHTGIVRETRLEHTLYACDEVSGFVHACGLVRPDGLATLEVRSVRKKLKQPSFARGVHRGEVVDGAQELGVDLDEHITFVIAALRPIAAELGLPG